MHRTADRAARGVVIASTIAALAVLTGCASAPAASEAGVDEGGDYSGVTVRVVNVGTEGANVGFLADDIPTAVGELGADAEIVGNFPALAPALEALAGGTGDVTRGSITSALSAMSGGAEITIFSYSPDIPNSAAIVVAEGSDIAGPADLAGRSVAVNQGGTGEYLLDMTLEEYEIDPSSVTKVYLSPGDAAAAFGSGSVDAWATFDTFIPIALEQLEGRVLVESQTDVTLNNDLVLIARTAFAEEYPELLKAVADGWARGAERAKEDPAQYLAVEQSVNGYSDSALAYIETTMQSFSPVTPDVVERFQEVADRWAAVGTLPSRVDVADFVVDVSTVG